MGLTPEASTSPLTLLPAQLGGGCPKCHRNAHLARQKLHSELWATATTKCQHNLNSIFLENVGTSIICFEDLGYYLRNYAISQNRKGFSLYNSFERTTYVHNYLCKSSTVQKGRQVDPEKSKLSESIYKVPFVWVKKRFLPDSTMNVPPLSAALPV